ncbi:MAG TPA: hypothetical protein VFF04_07040 [Candidatus Babeliales bacterium]|nr:hypothetical protein [Candidatus Babeliales bacterium]
MKFNRHAMLLYIMTLLINQNIHAAEMLMGNPLEAAKLCLCTMPKEALAAASCMCANVFPTNFTFNVNININDFIKQGTKLMVDVGAFVTKETLEDVLLLGTGFIGAREAVAGIGEVAHSFKMAPVITEEKKQPLSLQGDSATRFSLPLSPKPFWSDEEDENKSSTLSQGQKKRAKREAKKILEQKALSSRTFKAGLVRTTVGATMSICSFYYAMTPKS